MTLVSKFVTKAKTTPVARTMAVAAIATLLNAAAAPAQGLNDGYTTSLNSGTAPHVTFTGTAKWNGKRTRIDNPKVHERHGVRAPQVVTYTGAEKPGNMILDHMHQYVYFILPGGKAIEYVAAVGRDGKVITSANHYVAEKVVEANWYTANGAIYGPATPLGERAFFMKRRGSNIDDDYAMHGTDKPWLLAAPDGKRRYSAGCIRLINPDILDLYKRVQVGAHITVDFKGEVARQIIRNSPVAAQTLTHN